MHFYMKLASKKDNDKLKGIVLFEDFGKNYSGKKFGTLPLGTGKTTYKFDTYEESVIPYTYEMKDIFERISSILPNARLCYVSALDDGSGVRDIMLKMENDPKIYTCSTMWDEHNDIGSDSWCERAVKVIEEEELLLERANEWVRQMFEEDDDEDYEDDEDEDYEDDEDEDYEDDEDEDYEDDEDEDYDL